MQHIESLNDVISQITGVAVKETLPDTVLERADDIELDDMTPDELVERLCHWEKSMFPPRRSERLNISFKRETSSRFGNCRFGRWQVECSKMLKLPDKSVPLSHPG